MLHFTQSYIIGFIRFSNIWSDRADREKEVHKRRKAIAKTGVFCYIIVFYNYIPLLIYILVSDFDIIKQTVRRKRIEVKTTETRLKLFSFTMYPFDAKMTIKTKGLRDDVKWNMMISVPDTFYFTVFVLRYRLLIIRSSFRVLSSSLRSNCAHRSFSVHRALIIRSLGALCSP